MRSLAFDSQWSFGSAAVQGVVANMRQLFDTLLRLCSCVHIDPSLAAPAVNPAGSQARTLAFVFVGNIFAGCCRRPAGNRGVKIRRTPKCLGSTGGAPGQRLPLLLPLPFDLPLPFALLGLRVAAAPASASSSASSASAAALAFCSLLAVCWLNPP